MTNRPKAIGTTCETAIVRYVRPNGFPFADRLALHGALDEADVQLCPGAVVESKGGKAAETASDAQIVAWMTETETERVNRGADVALLVTKRKGVGLANAGRWWAWIPGWAFLYLAIPDLSANHYRAGFGDLPAVRMTLADAVTLLRRAGYGDPLP